MADGFNGNDGRGAECSLPADKVPVPLLMDKLRNQVFGLQSGLGAAASTSIRKSVTAMENQLEENNNDHQRDVREISAAYQKEIKRKQEEFLVTINRLKNELEDKSRFTNDLEGRLREYRQSREDTSNELAKCKKVHTDRVNELEACITESRQQLILLEKELEAFKSEGGKIQELESSLKHERNQVGELTSTIEEMEADLNSKLKSIQELKQAKFEVEAKVTTLENEKYELAEKLKQQHEMKKVQNDSGDSLRKVLEEQVTKAQKERSDLHEMLVKVQNEKAKLQKEIDLKKVDLRLESRKVKDLETKLLQKEHLYEGAKSKITVLEESKQASVSKIETLQNEIESLNETIKINTQELTKIIAAKREISEQKEKLDTDNLILRNQLGIMKAKVNDCEMLEKLVKDQEATIEEKNRVITENKTQIRKLTGNVVVLKETCSTLDEQLKTFEDVFKCKLKELDSVEKSSKDMETENAKLIKQLQKCRIELNEVKSLKSFTEKKLQSIEGSLRSETLSKKTEVQTIQEKLSLAIRRGDDLSTQITTYISQISQLENEKFELQKSKDLLTSTKERQSKETSQLVNTVVDLKEVNVQLQNALKEAISKGECYKEKYEAMEEEYRQLVQSKSTNDIMQNTQLQQRDKLINHLYEQLSLHQDKKKKKVLPSFTPKRTEKEMHGVTPVRTEARNKQTPLPPYYLEQKEVERLEVRKADLKNRLLSLQTNTPVSSKTPTLPIPRREECVLLKDKCNTIAGTDATSIGSFHDFEEGSCRNVQKCMFCRDPIYLGRLMAKCKQCLLAFHRLCTNRASNTCGLSEKSAYELEKCVSTEREEPIADEVDDDLIRGWVKVRSPNMPVAGKKYLKIIGSTLCIYKGEQNRHPLEIFQINDNTILYYRVDDKEDTPSSDKYALACALKVTFYTDDYAPPTVLFMFLRNEVQKRYWMRAIMKHTKMIQMSSLDNTLASQLSLNDDDKENIPIKIRDNLLLEDRADKEDKIYVNCIYWLDSSHTYVLGCDDGLYSLKNIGDKPVKIRGPQSIYQIGVLAGAKAAVFIEGQERVLSVVYSGLLKTCAEAAECSEPKLTTERVALTKSCYLFVSRSKSIKDTLVAAAGSCGLIICAWAGDGLSVIKQMTTKDCITTLLMTPNSVLYGNYSVFEVDTITFEIEEFLDMSDPTIYLVQILNESRGSFPVAILDVSQSHGSKSKEVEYLICFQDIGIFVDMYGRRTRKDDILWSQAPLSLEYRHPYLFIFHFTCIEIQEIDDKSYTRVSTIARGMSRDGKDGELVAKSIGIKPLTKFFSVSSKSSPKYIGNGANPHGVVFALNEARSVKVIEITGS